MTITDEVPKGIPLQQWRVDSEQEAQEIAGNFPAYLVKSKIDDKYYLFIPAIEQSLTKM
jgi:hypothetical protein